ncbi:Gfo/Idh/MocA family protein [Micromonospora sp. MS34]|uniref:Gfo/Idh/MocA family protein n=1 Tax=Micromonospora sp. MS34 TaxID=3385971 RepID=UPI00399FC228
MRTGIIGVGNRARSLVRAAQMAGVLDVTCYHSRDESTARTLLPHATGCPDAESVIEKVDAVIIAAPNSTHADLAVRALGAGRHVFCEKPLGLDLPELRRVLTAADRADGILQVGTELRYAPMVRDITAAVAAAATPARLLWAQEFRGPLRPGVDGWRLDPARSGGTLLEKNTHHFDLFAVWAHAASPGARPVQVHAVAGNEHARGVADHAVVTVVFDSGALATLSVSLLEDEERLRVGVLGSGWSVEYDNRHQSVEMRDAGRVERTAYDVDVRGVNAGGFDHPGEVEQLVAFAERAAGRRDGEAVSPYWGHLIAYGARESARTGQSVDLLAMERM